MDTRYHVMFAGELQEGEALADVRAKMAKLFNANEATLDKLFSGQQQTIKRDCDRATAAKYKAAIEKAGGKPIIKVATADAQAAAPEAPASTPTQAAGEKPQTAAEKIAALAAAADAQPAYGSSAGETAEATTPAPQENTPEEPASAGDALLAPTGSDVLRPEERHEQPTASIDTSGLSMDDLTDRLAPETAPPPPAPDTSHLDMGEVGDTIPTLVREQATLDPNTDAISLAPEGSDFSDCTPEQAESPELDLSAMDLAPTGADVLEEQYRKKETTQAPDTDHLALDD